ncbi:unnamed protein product [Scytosiphon promiscuus]
MDEKSNAEERRAIPHDSVHLPEEGLDAHNERASSPERGEITAFTSVDFGPEAGALETFDDLDGVWSSPNASFVDMPDSFHEEFAAQYPLPEAVASMESSMESAICTCSVREVKALLDLLVDMGKVSIIKELSGCYGGRRGHPPRADDNGLYRMSVPLLHASLTGNVEIFMTVLGAMRVHLRAQQIKRAMTARDGHGRSTLTTALTSKSKEMFEAVLNSLEEELTRDEIQELLMDSDADGQKILHWAAATGSKDMFEAVLMALNDRLRNGQVEILLAASTAAASDDIFCESRTILNSAAISGGPEVFEAVLSQLEAHWSGWQVKRMMMYQDMGFQENVLISAIKSGSPDAFRAVLYSTSKRLTPQEVTDLVLRADEGKNILHAAAEGGSKDVFGAVLSALQQEVDLGKIRTMFRSGAKHGRTILHFAARSGDEEGFEAALFAVKNALTAAEVKDMMMLESSNRVGSILHSAASSGRREIFEAVLASLELELSQDEVKTMLMSEGKGGKTLVYWAVCSGSKDLFEAVVAAVASDQRSSATTTFVVDEGLLVAAAKSGNVELWQAVVKRVRDGPCDGRVVCNDESASLVLRTAASQGSVQMWEVVVDDLLEQSEQVRCLVLNNSDLAKQLFKGAVRSQSPAIVRAVVDFMRGTPPAQQGPVDFGELIGSGFSAWTTMVLERTNVRPGAGGGLVWAIEVLSCLLHYPVVFDPEDLIKLSREQSSEWLRTCFLETVACCDNPFVPGMTLSIAFTKAASKAREGERRKLLSLQGRVDTLLLEVLERLPQTVQGFDGGMSGCSAVFEPEFSIEDARGFPGPLRMALQERQQVQTFCTKPLLTDFLSRRFTHGLPGLRDTQNVLGDRSELVNLARGGPGEWMSGQKYLTLTQEEQEKEDDRCLGRCLLLDIQDKVGQEGPLFGARKVLSTLLSPCILLQGANCDGLWNNAVGLTFLPGAQFVAAGLVGMPDQYFRVPAMRMMLDLVVYLGMLALFSGVVLFHEDGPVTSGEIAFAFYILAGGITEGREMSRDFSLYAADHWNILDILGLGLVTGGFLVRCADGGNPWGRALYALSAPLVFSRLLFFAQMLRFHGPMIQVVFSMTAELVKFGVVILVVMLGFAMSFHALFGDVDTFGKTCLTLFKAMLGELGFFDEFPGDDFDSVATALFVIYLVVIAVMLLNLLIAVLSTSHSKVEGKADQEFKVSKARMIEHYRLVVDICLLPPPFNLVQLVISSLFLIRDQSRNTRACRRAKEAVGQTIFWLVLGPVAVGCGSILWMLSLFYAPFVWHRHFFGRSQAARKSPVSAGGMLLRYFTVAVWCVVGAPLYLVLLWITSPIKWLKLRPWQWLWDRRQAPYIASWKAKSVNDLLEGNSGGLVASDLQAYLEDPISDPEVRHDETSRATTVEHIKLLRNRLEKTCRTHLDAGVDRLNGEISSSVLGFNLRLTRLEEEVAGMKNHLDGQLARVEQEVVIAQGNVGKKVDELLGLTEIVMGRRGT